MKSVLISTRPKWCKKICHEIGKDENGKPIYEKRIEVRKSAPKKVPFKAYIYCTKEHANEIVLLKDYKNRFSFGDYRKADDHFYTIVNGEVIGEFICDRIDEYKYVYCDHPEIGYPVGYDCGDNWYDIDDEDLQKACLTEEEFKRYGNGKLLYGWHISDLKIYDKPKELSEFKTPPCEKPEKACENCKYRVVINTPDMYEVDCFVANGMEITRSPQSYMFVEELK